MSETAEFAPLSTLIASGLPATTRDDSLDVTPSDVLLTLALYLDGVLSPPREPPGSPPGLSGSLPAMSGPAPSAPGVSGPLPDLQPATHGPSPGHAPSPLSRAVARIPISYARTPAPRRRKTPAPTTNKSPSRPYKPRSAFTLFRIANHNSADCHAMWKSATDEEKKPFLDRYAILWEAYKKRLEAFEMGTRQLDPTEQIKKEKSTDSDTPSHTTTAHEVTVWKLPELREATPPMNLNQGASFGADLDLVVSTRLADAFLPLEKQPNQQHGFFDAQLLNDFNPLLPFFQNPVTAPMVTPHFATPASSYNPWQQFNILQSPSSFHSFPETPFTSMQPSQFLSSYSDAFFSHHPAQITQAAPFPTHNTLNSLQIMAHQQLPTQLPPPFLDFPRHQQSFNHASSLSSAAAFVPSFMAVNQAFQDSNLGDSVVPTALFGFETIADVGKEGGCQEFGSLVEFLNQ
ncbi:hypothetical protein HDU98_012194 [Podochytrium sp. JEL0797]|nr:hypothetical protein HDU98_012194 [Podochytrium sp. JEL0797]